MNETGFFFSSLKIIEVAVFHTFAYYRLFTQKCLCILVSLLHVRFLHSTDILDYLLKSVTLKR